MKIEKGIPIPQRRRHKGKWINVVSLMEVGDSILLDCKSASDSDAMACVAAGRNIGFKLSVRTLSEGVRVWRVQ